MDIRPFSVLSKLDCVQHYEHKSYTVRAMVTGCRSCQVAKAMFSCHEQVNRHNSKQVFVCNWGRGPWKFKVLVGV